MTDQIQIIELWREHLAVTKLANLTLTHSHAKDKKKSSVNVTAGWSIAGQ